MYQCGIEIDEIGTERFYSSGLGKAKILTDCQLPGDIDNLSDALEESLR